MAPQLNTQEIFDGLTENALHFLDEGIKDFENDDLQQSLINFVTGVELVLKARLLLEHWTLILSDPRSADPGEFVHGKFHSVGSGEAIKRLRRIVGLSIPDTAEKAFEGIRDHRNKMTHFYHPEYTSGENSKIKEDIAGLELNGWGHLYVLVARGWKEEFYTFLDRFEAIDIAMMKHKDFLKGKYEGLKPQIDKEIADGIPYMDCSPCGNMASRLEEDEYPIYNGFCQICIGWMVFLEVKCEDCDSTNYFDRNDDERRCSGCENTFSMEYLVDLYGNEIPGDASTNGFCYECHHAYSGHTVVERDHGEIPKYVCLSCYEIYEEMDQCQRCGENLAGKHPETGTYGCVDCGKALQEKRDQE